MTQFSSRPPFNDDPTPWAIRHWDAGPRPRSDYPGFDAPEWFDRENSADYLPRPEFDRPQHNPTNALLLGARRAQADGCLADFMDGFLSNPIVDHPEISHARRVLTRLANLTKEIA